jgi:hypothetical protein
MLLNFSNHCSKEWSDLQHLASKKYGNIIDFQFPMIDPLSNIYQIEQLVEEYEIKIRKMLSKDNTGASAVHIMGELTFCHALVNRLQQAEIICLASTTNRETVNNPDGTKTVKFGFVRFREYSTIR